MAKQQPHPDEQQLIHKMLSFKDDPLAFVLYNFPWGKPGTPLEHHTGPRQWQLDALVRMRDHVQANINKQRQGLDPELLKLARASGRGIGKSAFLAWVALWLFSCLPSSTVVVSANTEQQLKSTTFPEIRKWATMGLNSRWFEHNIMSLQPAEWLVQTLKDQFGRTPRMEGKDIGDWVLIDTGDVIVHVFRPEVREFYQLEKMWLSGADTAGPSH